MKAHTYKNTYSDKGFTQGSQGNQTIETYCNNCGKFGHIFYHCKVPITSIGLIVFRKDADNIRYLMIRRKDTLGFMDFMRGKYSIYNREYIENLLKQMTYNEKMMLKSNDFETLWRNLWNKNNDAEYKFEQHISADKFNSLKNGIHLQNRGECENTYSLNELIDKSLENDTKWEEPEWGFPKGRRNPLEKDFECALREFCEETGYSKKHLKFVENVQPFEEIFMGSNYKSYKHKYFLMNLPNYIESSELYDNSEVSKVEWKTYEECIQCMRPYNLEKMRLLEGVHMTLSNYMMLPSTKIYPKYTF
jgi:8-oxo-dGTP pyrophosphatase MutT (NUDIX family)